MARAVLSQAQIASQVLNNNISARLTRARYSDVWPWTFTRASVDGALAINAPKLDPAAGIRVMEGTTNLLPAGAENFVTGWKNGTGETCTVTDYPVNIPGIGDVIAKRITGNGAGSIGRKYVCNTTGLANPHTIVMSVYAQRLSGVSYVASAETSGGLIPTTISKISLVSTRSSTINGFYFQANTPTDILDIVVYAPAIEAKPYATSYTPPGTTRAAESLSIPVNAVDLGGGVIDYSNAVLNPTAGTIEMDVIMPPSCKDAVYRTLFDTGNGVANTSLKLTCYHNALGIFPVVQVGYGSGMDTVFLPTMTENVKNRLGVKFQSGNKTTLWMNGAKIATSANNPIISLGSVLSLFNSYAKTAQGNGYLSNLRISNIARADAEMAYTGPLKADQYTTFFAPWKVVS